MNSDTDNTGDLTWGYLADTEAYGRRTTRDDFIQMHKDTVPNDYDVKNEASHCLIYAKNNTKVFNIYHPRASILMQLRFDGYLGFPGGIVDPGETDVDSVNRELVEEMCLDTSKHCVQPNNYIISHYNKKIGLMLHFYALEVTMEELKNIEQRALNAKDYGIEVLGNVRIPLYTMGDSFRGFPSFLQHNFVGNSKEQLLYTLEHLNLMTNKEIARALDAAQ